MTKVIPEDNVCHISAKLHSTEYVTAFNKETFIVYFLSEVSMTFFEQLQCDYSQISEMIKAHRVIIQDEPVDTAPMKMLHDVYLETLEDALKTASAMLDNLKK